MSPQPVLIHGTPCVLKATGGGRLTSYTVTRRDTGAVLTEQPARFLAMARAAAVLRNPEPQRSPA